MTRDEEAALPRISGGAGLYVRHTRWAVEWYVRRLGFQLVRDHVSGNKYIYAHLRRDNAELMILDRRWYAAAGHIPQSFPVGVAKVVFDVVGLDRLREELGDLVESSRDHQLRLRDLDGNRVVFRGRIKGSQR